MSDADHQAPGTGAPERAFDADCPLCEAARISPWHHEDDVCWVADCTICATPMVVWRGHGIDPPPDERGHMMAVLARVATAQLGAHWVDANMRNIPDHFHAHARPEGGFFGPGGGPGRFLG
ncbi:MAG: hypothetical protein U0P45_09575 [Acidimicrobiales bacterium]